PPLAHCNALRSVRAIPPARRSDAWSRLCSTSVATAARGARAADRVVRDREGAASRGVSVSENRHCAEPSPLRAAPGAPAATSSPSWNGRTGMPSLAFPFPAADGRAAAQSGWARKLVVCELRRRRRCEPITDATAPPGSTCTGVLDEADVGSRTALPERDP